jgi:hypothetical protein
MATDESAKMASGSRMAGDEEKGLYKTQTGVTMSPELFEKLYLTPKVPQVGDYNKRFANPTALGFVGWVTLVYSDPSRTPWILTGHSFVISTFTFAIICMGWGGAQGFSPVV